MSKRRADQRVFRSFSWLILLLAVGLVAQSTIVDHQARVRGLPSGFPPPVAGADVPILGVNVALEQYDDAGLEAALTRIAAAGFVWVRQSFYWSQIELEPGDALSLSKDRFDWTASDRILAALAHYPQLRLVAVLDDSPLEPPDDPDRFAAFARAFAARYGAQVDDYQIWDEPNLAAHWGGGPVNPPAYADLLARAACAIRAADRSTALTAGPESRVILAGLAPTVETGPQNLSDVRYLEQLYQAGAAPYFDVVAGKPYGFDTGTDDRRADETVLNFSRLLLLREVMVEHGDADKAIWASHWGWNALPGPSAGPSTGSEGTSGQGQTGAPSLWGQTDEAIQAARTVAALERARAEWPWAGALILEHFQPAVPADDPHWGFALVGQGGVPRPVYDAVLAWDAALPDAAPVGGYPAHNAWATYGEDWRVGPLGADVGRSTRLTTSSDGGRATFRFDGTSVALTVRRGAYRAFLYVAVDGAPANGLPQDEEGRAYVVLYDDAPTIATVPLATGLSPGPHTVEVVAEGGQGQWVLVDWRVGADPVSDGYGWKVIGLAAAGLALAALLLRDARQVDWAALGRRFLGWPEWAQVTLVVGLTALLWATAGASWGRDWGSPWFVVSLLTLPALTALFALRPDLGLALVVFTAPFYLHPGDMFYRALSMPETLVVLCGIASLGGSKIAPRGLPNRSTEAHERPRFGPGSDDPDRAKLDLPSLRTRRFADLRISPIDRGVVLIVLAAVVAGLTVEDLKAALFELRTVFLFPALYYVLLRLARRSAEPSSRAQAEGRSRQSLDGRVRWRIVDGFVLGAVGVAVIGLVQYALGRNVVAAEGGLLRLQSVYYSPNNVGLYLGRVWPLLVAVALWGGRGRRQMFYRLALAPVTLALVLSFSRGALLLGLPAALLVMGWRVGGRYRWATLALVVCGALSLIPLLRVPRFASLLDLRQGSTFFRLELWRSSLTLIREHPWFGVGPGNFLNVYRTRYVLPSAWQEFNLEHPHNVYLDHWTRLGLLGVLAGAVVQVAFWWKMWRRGKGDVLILGFAGGMVTLLAHGLVDNTVFFPDLALALFLILALAQGGTDHPVPDSVGKPVPGARGPRPGRTPILPGHSPERGIHGRRHLHH